MPTKHYPHSILISERIRLQLLCRKTSTDKWMPISSTSCNTVISDDHHFDPAVVKHSIRLISLNSECLFAFKLIDAHPENFTSIAAKISLDGVSINSSGGMETVGCNKKELLIEHFKGKSEKRSIIIRNNQTTIDPNQTDDSSTVGIIKIGFYEVVRVPLDKLASSSDSQLDCFSCTKPKQVKVADIESKSMCINTSTETFAITPPTKHSCFVPVSGVSHADSELLIMYGTEATKQKQLKLREDSDVEVEVVEDEIVNNQTLMPEQYHALYTQQSIKREEEIIHHTQRPRKKHKKDALYVTDLTQDEI